MINFICPDCNNRAHEKWALPKLTYLNLVLNPGIAFAELLFGVCISKAIYICTSCEKPLMERSFLHCPTCDSFHNGKIWSKKNALGHWLGLVCPKCGQLMPRLWNVTSLIILAITLPIWWIPVQLFKERWIKYERRRLALAVETTEVIDKPVSWYKLGLIWGFSTGILTSLITTFTIKNMSYFDNLIFNLEIFPLWIVGGLIFGFAMKRKLMKIGKKE